MQKNKLISIEEKHKLVRTFQILGFIIMLAMVAGAVFLIIKYDISVSNLDILLSLFSGGVITAAIMIILFNLIKSFALVVSPSIAFLISGLIFKDYAMAIGVNLIAVSIGLIPIYFFGKFLGAEIIDVLKKKFPKLKKIDDFVGENEFLLCLTLKAANLIPGDLSSLIFGAMRLPFWKYYIASILGTLPLNIMWVIVGIKGDVNDPKTLFYLIPIFAFAGIMSLIMALTANKNKKNNK